MYLPSFILITSDLRTNGGMVQLTLAGFFVGYASGQLVYGPLSDRFGRKPPLYAGLGMFIAASIGCMLAPNVLALIGLRFLQGLGACAGIVIARAAIRDRRGPEGSAKAYSMMMLISGLSPVLAPLLGGWIMILFGWRAIFAALTLGGVMCLVFMHFTVEETLDRSKAIPLRIGNVMRQYGTLLGDRYFVACALCGGLIHAGVFAYVAASPSILIKTFGVAAQHYGWVFGANACGMILVAQINARLVNRLPLHTLLQRAIILMLASALLMLALELTGFNTLWVMLAGFFIFISSFGAIAPNASAMAMTKHGHQAGTASALLGAMHFCLSTLSCITVSIWQDGTALPLLTVVALCGIASVAVYRRLVKPQSALLFAAKSQCTTN